MSAYIIMTSLMLFLVTWALGAYVLRLSAFDAFDTLGTGFVRGKELFPFKRILGSCLLGLPFIYSPVFPITYYVFEAWSFGLWPYIFVHVLLLCLFGYYLLRLRRRLGSFGGGGLGRLGSAVFFAIAWVLFVFYLVVGIRLSLPESLQPEPQALVTYSVLRFVHWLSILLYLGYAFGVLWRVTIAERGRGAFVMLLFASLLFLLLVLFSASHIQQSFASACYRHLRCV